MTSEIRANTIKNRVGLGTVSFTNTGAIVSGIVTATGADINGDLDVDGHTNLDNVNVAGVTTMSGNLTISNTDPQLAIHDTNHNPSHYYLKGVGGAFKITDSTNGDRLSFNANGSISVTASLFNIVGGSQVSSNLGVTGNLILTDNIIHDGDTDTKIRFPANDQIQFEAGGNEKLKLDSSGNVYFAGNRSGNDRGIIYNDSNGFGIYGSSSGSNHRNIIFFSSSSGTSERLRITTGGKVGINQSSNIQTRLHVSENIADSTSLNWANSTMSLTSEVGGNSTANRSTLYFAPYNAANQYCPAAISVTAETNYQSTLKFFTNAAGNGTGHLESTERLRITTSGHILPGAAGTQNLGSTSKEWGNIYVGDSKILYMGSDQDLSISHNGTHGYIHAATGGLYVKVGNGEFLSRNGSQVIAKFLEGTGGVELYYNNSKKFNTTNTGATITGHFLPDANNVYDLGSTAKGWRNVYMNDLNLSNMNGNINDVDGTQGSWTIQEGKDDLYIINRLNGKKFKIKLEEIS